MTLLQQMAPGALGPGFASAAVFAVAWLLSRRPGREWMLDRGILLAVTTGFSVGFLVILRWPSLPLAPGTDGWYWVAWFAPAALLVGWGESSVRLAELVKLVLRLAVSTGAAWLLVQPIHAWTPGERWRVVAVAAAGTTLLWTVVARSRRDQPPEASILASIVTAGATAAVLAFVSGSLWMGQVTGALGAALSGLLALAVLLERRSIAAPTAPATALLLGGVLLSAYAYLNYSDVVNFPPASALLLLGGAVVGTVLPRLVPPGGNRLVGVLLAVAPPLLLSALAAWVAHAGLPPPNPYA